MRKQKFDSQELALISTSYMKKLFPVPKSSELFVEKGVISNDGSYNLFYEDNYFSKYSNAVKQAHQSGAFAKSNAENAWVSLMSKILSAEPITTPDMNTLEEYWLTEK